MVVNFGDLITKIYQSPGSRAVREELRTNPGSIQIESMTKYCHTH